jgi:hypothetical protein
MKIEVKNIKINNSFSEETLCFVGDLYLDGKKVGICKNDGHGGETYYQCIKTFNNEDITKMEQYCKTLPKNKFGEREYEQSLSELIDDIVYEYFNRKDKEKFQKKMEKDMLTKLVLSKGIPNQYETMGWKGYTIQQIIDNPKGRVGLKESIQNLKNKGYIILNTNIPQELM